MAKGELDISIYTTQRSLCSVPHHGGGFSIPYLASKRVRTFFRPVPGTINIFPEMNLFQDLAFVHTLQTKLYRVFTSAFSVLLAQWLSRLHATWLCCTLRVTLRFSASRAPLSWNPVYPNASIVAFNASSTETWSWKRGSRWETLPLRVCLQLVAARDYRREQSTPAYMGAEGAYLVLLIGSRTFGICCYCHTPYCTAPFPT